MEHGRQAVLHRRLRKLRLPTPEDMVILKALASRPKDLEDIRNLGLVHDNIDRTRIEYWLE